MTPEWYCSHSVSLPDCSEDWYPSVLDTFEVIESEGHRNLCVMREEFGGSGDFDCFNYEHGDPDLVIGAEPDRYCSRSSGSTDCSEDWYPSVLDEFELRAIDGQRNLCVARDEFGSSDFDCSRYAGGDPDQVLNGDPEHRCTASFDAFECSDEWYPSDLADYEFYEINGVDFVCVDAGYGANSEDVDCSPYEGGDPERSLRLDALKCSPEGSGFECRDDYYPSEAEGLSFVTIEGRDHVCESTRSGELCYEWDGYGSPADAIGRVPDFYCNRLGCAKDYFP